MKVLKPGQRVPLHEDTSEPFGRVEGRIDSVTLFDDLSAHYSVKWWSEGEPMVDQFSVAEVEAIGEPRYIEVLVDWEAA